MEDCRLCELGIERLEHVRTPCLITIPDHKVHYYNIAQLELGVSFLNASRNRWNHREQACTISPHWSKDSYGYVGQTTMAIPILSKQQC
ncbi:hypothetical protein M0804_007161 [Polistes exclamans]|nr:hypothetical protein M0804_007161 [Polistes exclamans]